MRTCITSRHVNANREWSLCIAPRHAEKMLEHRNYSQNGQRTQQQVSMVDAIRRRTKAHLVGDVREVAWGGPRKLRSIYRLLASHQTGGAVGEMGVEVVDRVAVHEACVDILQEARFPLFVIRLQTRPIIDKAEGKVFGNSWRLISAHVE